MRRILMTLSGIAAVGLTIFAAPPSLQLLSSSFVPMQSPAPQGSAQPHLTLAGNGRVLLSWLTPRTVPPAAEGQKPGTVHSFQFAELTGERWSAPRTIVEGPRMFANWADFPTMFVTRGGVMAAH